MEGNDGLKEGVPSADTFSNNCQLNLMQSHTPWSSLVISQRVVVSGERRRIWPPNIVREPVVSGFRDSEGAEEIDGLLNPEP